MVQSGIVLFNGVEPDPGQVKAKGADVVVCPWVPVFCRRVCAEDGGPGGVPFRLECCADVVIYHKEAGT